MVDCFVDSTSANPPLRPSHRQKAKTHLSVLFAHTAPRLFGFLSFCVDVACPSHPSLSCRSLSLHVFPCCYLPSNRSIGGSVGRPLVLNRQLRPSWRFVTADTIGQAITEKHQAALWAHVGEADGLSNGGNDGVQITAGQFFEKKRNVRMTSRGNARVIYYRNSHSPLSFPCSRGRR